MRVKSPRFGFVRYLQPPGRSRPITVGQSLVWDQLAPLVGRLLSPRDARTFDQIVADAATAAARVNVDAPSREQLALELVLLLEHGLARVEPVRAREAQ
jgi:hypothetical protein